MTNLTQTYYKIFILDELASKRSVIHKRHPVMKLMVTLLYLVFVLSYSKYEISALLPLALYPVLLISLGDVPLKPILTGLLVAAPLIIGIGIFNPILDRSAAVTLGNIYISAGMLSFAALLLKCCLTVTAALLLIATTGMNKIAAALSRLHVPQVFIVQLLLTYRYITVLLMEASRISNAYMLRAPRQRGISMKVWGSLLGQLLLRTYDRAQKVYQAMKLRGFENQYFGVNLEKIAIGDIAYLAAWGGFFIAARIFNLSLLVGNLVTGVIK